MSKARAQLLREHTDWFNPTRSVFTFSTPTLSSLTNSRYAKSVGPIVRPFVMLNHSIRRLFENIERYQAFVFGDLAMYQGVLHKFSVSPGDGSSTTPKIVVTPDPSRVGLTEAEMVYVEHIFLMNETMHQGLIGGVDSKDENCLYKAFRTARKALQEFKKGLKREPLPDWFPLLHLVAGVLAWVGFWELMRWFDIW